MIQRPRITDPQAGESQRIAGIAELSRAALRLTETGQRELAIFSRELEPGLYDDAAFVSQVSRIARSGRHARVRLLIREHDRLIKHGHPLVRLAQQLPSHVEIRMIARAHQHQVQGFLVVDDARVLYQPQAEVYEAKTCPHDRRWAHDLLAEFQGMWDHAHPDQQLRRLSLIG